MPSKPTGIASSTENHRACFATGSRAFHGRALFAALTICAAPLPARAAEPSCNFEGWTEFAGAQRTDSAPTIVTSLPGGTPYAFVRGLDGQLQAHFGTSAGWEHLEIGTTEQPGAAIESNGALDMVVRSETGVLMLSRFVPKTHTSASWTELPGPGVVGAPAVVAGSILASPTYYVTGHDRRVYWNRSNCDTIFPCGWGGWTALDGVEAASGPVAVVVPASGTTTVARTVLAVRGVDDRIYMNIDFGGWSQVSAPGALVIDRPAVVYYPPDRQLHLFARNSTNHVLHAYADFQSGVGAWSSWTQLGDVTSTSGLSAAVSRDKMIVFTKGLGETIMQSFCRPPSG